MFQAATMGELEQIFLNHPSFDFYIDCSTLVSRRIKNNMKKIASYKNVFLIILSVFLIIFAVIIPLLKVNQQRKADNNTQAPSGVESGAADVLEQKTDSTIIASVSADGSVNCYQNEAYFIAEKYSEEQHHILIKNKAVNDLDYDCSYLAEAADFEIKGLGIFYLNLVNNFLLVDKGTAPGTRGLDIYDLSNRTKIYTGFYGDGETPIKISGNTIMFWEPSSIKATAENCPDFAENEKNYFTSLIEEYTKFDLISLEKTSLNEFRCAARQ